MDQEQTIERLSRAARPTLFDAGCEPEILFALVLSNLMSPSLWAFRTTIEGNAALCGEGEPRAPMDAIQHYVNDHFFHLLPLDIDEIWGDLDLDQERGRLGSKTVDDATRAIAEEIRSRQAHGEVTDRIDVLPLIEQGRFPEYTYSTLDVLRAERRILKRKKHKPLGVTCCADEAILIASLAAVLHGVTIDELVIFGSVAHYTAFLRHNRRGCWFNGKREYFFKDDWARTAAVSQDAFDARLFSLDRIITPSGSYLLRDGDCTIEPVRLGTIEDGLTDFFGAALRQLREARPPRYRPGPLSGFSFAKLDRVAGAAEVEQIVRAMAADHPGTILETSFYAFRDLAVRHPEAYVRASLREHRPRQAAEGFGSPQDAVALVGAIEDSDSIFGTRERISLPSEVLMLRTGSDRDKALLLYALIQHAPGISPADKLNTKILLTDQDSFVGVEGSYISTRSFERFARVDPPIMLRLGAS